MEHKSRKRYSDKERRAITRQFHKSGYSRGRFCKETGIGYPTVNRFLEKEIEEKEAPKKEVSLVELKTTLIPVLGSSRVKCALPNGIHCEVELSMNESADFIRRLAGC